MKYSLLPAIALCVTPATAQLQSVVGPVIAPLGCSVRISFSNDTAQSWSHGVCPYVVRDAAGQQIAPGACTLQLAITAPGGTFSTSWPQIDAQGNQVLPGSYVVEVMLPDGTSHQHPITISPSTTPAVAPIGVARTGTTRNYGLCAPSQPNGAYLMLASLTANQGFATCSGRFPLDADPLLFHSATGQAPFVGFAGPLDARGETTAPALALPQLPALVGLPLHFAFAAVDPSQPCPVAAISTAQRIVIG